LETLHKCRKKHYACGATKVNFTSGGTLAATSTIPSGLLIGGAWRPAAGGAEIQVLDPATGEPIGAVADATVGDARAAVDAAAAAAPAWAATPPRERAEILRRGFELMRAREEEIAATITAEMGKPLPEARGEAAYAAEFLRWFAEEAVRAEGEYAIAPSGAARVLVLPQPVGISVLVTPWNFPAAMATRKLGPALAAGCTAIVKPATETPLTTLLIASMLEEAGAPPGVIGVLTTSRPGEVVAEMVEDRRVRKLSFTGSTEVGRRLLALAARTVVNVSMELGGNAPFLVLEDADVDAAVAGALAAKLRNGGEACTAANRFLVHESVAEAFTDGLTAAMAAVRMAPGAEPGAELGPMINEAAVAKIEALVADARERGARVRTGGARADGPGWFYPPTVLDRVAPGSAILREEVFGPVASVLTFSDEAEAIAAANDTEHGLVAYVFSRDLRRAMRVGEAIETGMVGLNRGVVSDPAAPFGGVKQSGIGREGGHHGLREFLEPKYFSFD
jgi:succinate-semialdehyde dehydrogenase/glutarate-semialdehyde dehydrogenase